MHDMRRRARALLAGALFIPLAAAKPAPPTLAEIGPEPAFDEAVAMTERAIRSKLVDPDSARLEWPYGFTGGSLKSMFGKRRVGWFTCGFVNARNRMGGYTGSAFFQVLIYNGSVIMLDIGDATERFDLVASSCEKMVKDGVLHPAPPIALMNMTNVAAANVSATAAAAEGGLGVSYLSTPVGAVLMAIAPGSRAEKAGLKPGATIEAINGISIKGMDPATIGTIIKSAEPVLMLKIVGVGDVVIKSSSAATTETKVVHPPRSIPASKPAPAPKVQCVTCQ